MIERAGADEGARRWSIAEVLAILAIAALTYRELLDPARLLGWIFGELPRGQHDWLRPWLSLVRGITNVLLAAVVATLLVRRAGVSTWIRRVAAGWMIFACLALPICAHVEVRFRVDEAPGNVRPYVSAFHDGGVAQTEMAARALAAGENPYAVTYDRPPMSRSPDSNPEGWRRLGYPAGNPAYAHVPYPPGGLIVATATLLAGEAVFGAYDVRFPYLACAIALAAILGSLVPRGSPRRIVWLITLLSPLLREYLILGRNDVLVLVPLAAFGVLFMRQRWRASAIALGVALAMKQFALFALPFWALVVARRTSWRTAARLGWPAFAIPIAISLPFFVWDPGAFVDDVFLFNVGVGEGAYPVRWDGFGVTPIAYALGLVDSPAGSNPLGWLFFPIVGGAAAAGWIWVARSPGPSTRRALVAAGVLLYAALFASRFFADNYLAVPSLLWAIAWLAPGGAGNGVLEGSSGDR
jgi:hypothetical protein